MKPARYFARFALFAAVFIGGLWIFAPWDECGLLAMEEIRAAAARRGYYVTYAGMVREGLFPPRYRFTGMDIEGPMVKATFSEATFSPAPIRSVLSLKAALRAEFAGVSVRYIPNNGFAMSRGEMRVSAGSGAILLDDIEIEGDLKMTGGVAVDMSEKAVTESTAVVNVPPEINMLLNTSIGARFVESVSPGEWRIKANARQDR